jgi:hypothetical protein
MYRGGQLRRKRKKKCHCGPRAVGGGLTQWAFWRWYFKSPKDNEIYGKLLPPSPVLTRRSRFILTSRSGISNQKSQVEGAKLKLPRNATTSAQRAARGGRNPLAIAAPLLPPQSPPHRRREWSTAGCFRSTAPTRRPDGDPRPKPPGQEHRR